MSLHIIIDGYNLIRQSSSLSRLDNQDLQLGRESLIDRLVAYKKLKRHRITVVFDGANATGLMDRRDNARGVRVIYSRHGETADAVIKQMAAKEREKALVVSSDRDITDHAAANQAAVVSSPDFEDRMAMAAYVAEKGVSPEPADHGGWQPTTRKKGPRRKLPKKARRNRQKVSKL